MGDNPNKSMINVTMSVTVVRAPVEKFIFGPRPRLHYDRCKSVPKCSNPDGDIFSNLL